MLTLWLSEASVALRARVSIVLLFFQNAVGVCDNSMLVCFSQITSCCCAYVCLGGFQSPQPAPLPCDPCQCCIPLPHVLIHCLVNCFCLKAVFTNAPSVMAAFWMTCAHSATTAFRLTLPSPWPSLLLVARLSTMRLFSTLPSQFSPLPSGSRLSCACRKGAWPDPQSCQANGQAQARQGPRQASSAIQPAVQEHCRWRRWQEEGAVLYFGFRLFLVSNALL